MKKIIMSFIIFLTSLVFAQEVDSTKYFLIRCDDFGMNHSVNMAIKKVIDTGIPFSTSVMFACPWYQEAVDILKENPQVGVGIHLTLNSEWQNYKWGPVLGKGGASSLVDSMGHFFPSRSKLFANNPKFEEIEKELRAQIDRAVNSGIRIDYLDYHMGAVVETKELRKLVEALAKEYGFGMSGYFSEQYSSITYGAPLGTKIDSLLNHVKNLSSGVNMQVFHVGIDDSEMSALKDMNTFGLKKMSVHRQEELNCVISPKLIELLNEENVIPISYKDLIKRIGLQNMYRPEDSEY
ncbi:MAG: ChbG/HpnK family deacetylase [Bacteroidetes bacterium]|nr:ChbG/HpnK family deacetylase [Bacteroidota bacterium]MBU1116241.1 ChbG/HpnK family deacetylase [Bacteroidota bacterium]MBU1799953.1 ChbG/HpnK family deacetylase [Bacteroidota bacterium]